MSEFYSATPFYLAILYSILTVCVGFQIGRILYYRHNLFSFQLGFLLLCFIWGVIRSCFWGLFPVISVKWGLAAMSLLWLPVNLQFATFSLLVVFYAHLVHRATWEASTKRLFTILYISVNTILLGVQIAFLSLYYYYADDHDEKGKDWIAEAQSSLSAIAFLILVFILAWYGYLLHTAIAQAKNFVLSAVPPQIFIVTFVIFMLFLTRCIFDFVNAGGHWEVEVTSDKVKDQVTVFTLYFFWEILPTIMILVMFWRIPTTQIGGIRPGRHRQNVYTLPFTPTTNPGGRVFTRDPAAGLVSRLFNDPQRYDSDDETTSFLRNGSPIAYAPTASTPQSFGKHTPYSTTPTPRSTNS